MRNAEVSLLDQRGRMLSKSISYCATCVWSQNACVWPALRTQVKVG